MERLSFTSWNDINIYLYKICCFLEPYTRSGNKINLELDFSSYPTKSEFKDATGVDTWRFAKKTDLASLKSDTDKSLLKRLYMFHWLKI